MRRGLRTFAAAAAMAVLAVSATLAVSPAPASAASSYVGVTGAESRCANHPTALVCFYYNYWDQAYWGTSVDDSNLGNNYYFSGTGQGSGQVVRNNSRKIHCDYYVAYACVSYYSPNYTGNYDYLYWGEVGELNYTWNDNASVEYF